MEKTNYNEVIDALIATCEVSSAIKNEIVLHDHDYQLTISLIKLDEE